MSDFVNLPLQKLLNRQNPITRIENLERGRAGPSAVVAQLGQIGQGTGSLIVDGSIVVPNRTDGQADVTIDDNGIVFRNQEGGMFFGDTAGSLYNLSISSGGTNDIEYVNDVPGAGHLLFATLTNASPALLSFKEPAGVPNVAQLNVGVEAGGSLISIDGELILWAGVDGKENKFNSGGYDIDHIFYDANGAEMLKIDAGAGTVTIAGISSGTYTPTLTNVANITSSSVANPFMYTRVGNVVTGSGRIIAAHDGTGDGQIRFTLPIASDLADTDDLQGNATNPAAVLSCSVIPDTTNNEAILFINQGVGTGSIGWRIVFQYVIV